MTWNVEGEHGKPRQEGTRSLEAVVAPETLKDLGRDERSETDVFSFKGTLQPVDLERRGPVEPVGPHSSIDHDHGRDRRQV